MLEKLFWAACNYRWVLVSLYVPAGPATLADGQLSRLSSLLRGRQLTDAAAQLPTFEQEDMEMRAQAAPLFPVRPLTEADLLKAIVEDRDAVLTESAKVGVWAQVIAS